MAKSWNRTETWVGLIVLGIGGIILGVAGLWIYVSATATPIHPSAQDVGSVSQSAPPERWAAAVGRSRAVMRAGLTEQNLPGVSVAVGMGGELVWAEGFGFADITTRAAVTPSTRFRLGTLSIPLTSAAAGLLVERGALNLDATIQTYVPDFPEKPWPVTVRQVMAHTAGLVSDGGDEGALFGRHCDRPVDALSEFAGRDLRFEPGSEYRYSRYGFVVVSAAIEQAADESFLMFMQKQLFEPLGMNDTAPDSVTDVPPGRATPYFPRFAADPRYGPDPMRDIDLSCYAGAGVFLSTPSDLVRFANAINAGKLLQPATADMLQSAQRLPSGADTGYGLGWDLETVTLGANSAVTTGHDGEVLGGVVGTLMTLRDRGLTIAILTNTSYADTAGLARRIADSFTAP